MGALRASCVVRVRVKDSAGSLKRVASGYLIAPATVLTAAHAVAGVSPQNIEVMVDVGGPGERSIVAMRVWYDDGEGSDLAAIQVASGVTPVPGSVFGRVDRDRDVVVDCVAVGFPWWKRRTDDGGLFRESEQISGTIAALSNLEERSLEMALGHGPPIGLDPVRSPWEGASGAAVFVGDVIVGVVAEHHAPEGPLHLTVRPVEAVYRLLSPDRLEEFRRLTGLPDQVTALVDVTALPAVATEVSRSAGATAPVVGDYAARIDNFLTEYLGTSASPRLFAGRDRELGQLSRWLDNDTAPPYQLVTAPGGRGKSALVVHWLAEVAGRDGCDVAFVPVSSRFRISLASVVFPALAGRLAELHGTTLPQASGWSAEEWRGIVSELLSRDPPRDQLVVILDGLDEAEGWEIGPDFLPLKPPPGLRVLVSARTLAGDEGPQEWLDRLGWNSPRLGASPLLLEPLDQEGVAQLLEAADVAFGSDADRRDAASHLWRLSQGDALLLSLYVARLASSGEDTLQVESLPAIPVGLDGYFDRWWEDQRRLWGQRTPLHEPAVRGILTLLACARGPITRDELLALEPSLDFWTLDEALHDLRRLISGSERRGLGFTHPELAAYFSRRLGDRERSRWEKRFCDWGRTERRALAEQPGSEVPSYLLQFWTSHLAAAGDRSELMALIWDRRWYAAQMASDPSGASFANDVRLALEESDRPDGRAGGHGSLADLVRCALVASTLNKLSANIDPALPEALVASGQWTIDQALAALRRNAHPANRVEALLAMSRLSPTSVDRERLLLEALQQIWSGQWPTMPLLEAWAAEKPRSLVGEALAEVRERLNGESLVQALLTLSRIRPSEDDAIVPEAFDLARTLPERKSGLVTNERASALAKVLGYASGTLASEVADAAIESARRTVDHKWRAISLGEIAACLDPPRRDDLAEEAFRHAQVEDSERGPAEALVRLATVLPDRLLADALNAGRSLSWPTGRKDVLIALVPRLPAELLADAAAAARELPQPWWCDQAMAALAARHAGLGETGQALSLVSEMQYPQFNERAIVSVVAALADEDPVTAATLIGRITRPWNRFEAWKALLDAAGEVGTQAGQQLVAVMSDHELRSAMRAGNTSREAREAVFESACQLIRTQRIDTAFQLLEALPDRETYDRRSRGAAYAQIIGLLPEDRIAEAVRRAFEAFQFIGDEDEQVIALSALARHAREPLHSQFVSQSIRLARRATSIEQRARRFEVVLTWLDDETAQAVISEFLSDMPKVNSETIAWQIWHLLSSRLTPTLKASILQTLADTASAEPIRAWLFERAAPILEDEQIPDALDLAQGLTQAELSIRAVAAIASRLQQPLRHHAVSGLLDRIEQLPAHHAAGYSPRADALARVASVLDEGLLFRAITILNSTSAEAGHQEYGKAVSALAPRVAESGRYDEALQLCRTVPGYWHVQALAQVVPHLPSTMLAEVEELAAEIEPLWRRGLAVALARRITDGHLSPLITEAVYAAATPDVWVGAGDHTAALEDLAPAITPEVITSVLGQAEKHPYASVRALATAYLARFLPAAYQEAAYSRALAHASSSGDIALLTRVGPLLPASLLPRLADDIAGISRAKSLSGYTQGAEPLAAVAELLLHLPKDDLSALAGRIIRASAARPRYQLLRELSALGAVFERVGTGDLVEAVALAVMQVADLWP